MIGKTTIQEVTKRLVATYNPIAIYLLDHMPGVALMKTMI